MGYTMVSDMGLPDFAVRMAIEKLSKRQEIISHADIAALIGCSIETVNRTMPRLIKAGIVTRTGSRRSGFRLEVKDEYLNN